MAKDNAVQLQIVDSKPEAMLNKAQKCFNRLTKQLEKLDSKLHEERIKLDEFLKLYAKKIPSYQDRLGKAQISAAIKLSESIDKHKFTKSEIEDIAGTIEMMLDQAFVYIEPDEETKAVYNMWAEVNYDEYVEEQTEDLKCELENLLREQKGIDMDLSDLNMNSPEAIRQFKERLKARMEDQEPQKEKKAGEKKKTKKQREQEARIDAEEKAQAKSLKGIYYSLVKVLHPDTASDPEEIFYKGELMKRVTVAYTKKDLSSLLRLEMEWLQVESDHINKLSEEKLDLYNGMLKNQIAELKMECDMLPSLPCYHSIRPFSYLTLRKGKIAIKETAGGLEFEVQKYEAICREMTSKKSILMLIKAIAPLVEAGKMEKLFGRITSNPRGFDC